MTTPHPHRWAPDQARTGMSCMDCQASGWDWQQAEIKRLEAELALQKFSGEDLLGHLVDYLRQIENLHAEIRRLEAELASKDQLLRNARDRRRKDLTSKAPPVGGYLNERKR